VSGFTIPGHAFYLVIDLKLHQHEVFNGHWLICSSMPEGQLYNDDGSTYCISCHQQLETNEWLFHAIVFWCQNIFTIENTQPSILQTTEMEAWNQSHDSLRPAFHSPIELSWVDIHPNPKDLLSIRSFQFQYMLGRDRILGWFIFWEHV
jgi:hypothetical protein